MVRRIFKHPDKPEFDFDAYKKEEAEAFLFFQPVKKLFFDRLTEVKGVPKSSKPNA